MAICRKFHQNWIRKIVWKGISEEIDSLNNGKENERNEKFANFIYFSNISLHFPGDFPSWENIKHGGQFFLWCQKERSMFFLFK